MVTEDFIKKSKNSINNLDCYGVILADVWLETDEKEKIHAKWDKNFFEEYKAQLNLDFDNEIDKKLKAGWWENTKDDYVKSFENWPENYRLLAMAFDIT